MQIGFCGTVLRSFALLILIHRILPGLLPDVPPPFRQSLAAIGISCTVYTLLAGPSLIIKFGLM